MAAESRHRARDLQGNYLDREREKKRGSGKKNLGRFSVEKTRHRLLRAYDRRRTIIRLIRFSLHRRIGQLDFNFDRRGERENARMFSKRSRKSVLPLIYRGFTQWFRPSYEKGRRVGKQREGSVRGGIGEIKGL